VSDFLLLGRIESLGATGPFKVTVAALPHRPRLELVAPDAKTFMCATAEQAESVMREEVLRAGERVRAAGHVVVDVRLEERGAFDEDRRT
jgi:hypothetical protein